MRAAVLALGAALGLCGMRGSALAEADYCADLKRLIDLAATDKLAYISGQPREGSFRDTTLPLAGWRDCSLYGARTYTCDLQGFKTNEQAEEALAALVAEFKGCLGDGWSKDESRSSPVYVVLGSEHEAVSMTLSADQTDDGGHVVRLTLFVRGRRP
jgi:hypothetical protein